MRGRKEEKEGGREEGRKKEGKKEREGKKEENERKKGKGREGGEKLVDASWMKEVKHFLGSDGTVD